jgi:hypothetical protein
MAARSQSTARNGRGLLREDHSEIKLVGAEDRDWWEKLSKGARARLAEKWRTKWTDEETRQLIEADPETNDYFTLGALMARTPGSLRIRRSMMIHLLRDEYEHVAKAEAYEADPKTHHRWADIGQVHRLLTEMSYYEKPVFEQFELARHLRQPNGSWRGDGTSQVVKSRKAQVELIGRLASTHRAKKRRA